jgi:hypothetical protein
MKSTINGLLAALLLSVSLEAASAPLVTTVKGPDGQVTTISTSGGTTTVTTGGTSEQNREGHNKNVKRVKDMYDSVK